MSSEIEIKRALRPHHHKFDNGILFRDALDRALAYAANHPRATAGQCVNFAIQPDRERRGWYRTAHQLKRRAA